MGRIRKGDRVICTDNEEYLIYGYALEDEDELGLVYIGDEEGNEIGVTMTQSGFNELIVVKTDYMWSALTGALDNYDFETEAIPSIENLAVEEIQFSEE